MRIHLRALTMGLVPVTVALGGLFSDGATLLAPNRPWEQEADVLQVETRLVQVDVVVADGNGPVADLTAEDFKLLDNGVPQQIEVFEVTRASNSSQGAGTLPPGIGSNRLDWHGQPLTSATVVLLDLLNTPTADQIYTIEQLRQFLESSAQLDRIALYDLRDGLRILHDYGADPDQLIEVAGQLEAEHSLELASSDTVGGFESELETVGLDRRLAEFTNSANVSDAVRQALNPDSVELFRPDRLGRESSDLNLNMRVQRTAQALEIIAHHLAGLPGRKNLVWLSARFPFAFNPYARSDLADEVEPETMARIERTGRALSRAGVAIYPVDVRGPQVGATANVGVMETIAEVTGGRTFVGSNDVAGAIRTAVEDGALTYTLGFYPREENVDDRFHELQVEVARTGVEVRHREGYFGGLASRGDGRLELVDLLLSPVDMTAIGLTAGTGFNEASGHYSLAVLVDVSDLRLELRDGLWSGAIEAAMYFSPLEEGAVKVIPPSTKQISLTDEEFRAVQRTGLVIPWEIDTNGQSGHLRFALQDGATGEAGSLWVPMGVE